MPSIQIRLATTANSDVSSVARLFDSYRQFYEQPTDLEKATNFIRARLESAESAILIAEDSDQKAVGFCQLYPTFCSVDASPIYSLYDLYVTPLARKLGIGKSLLLAAEELSKRNGMSRMDLTTAKTNFPAQALYESLGWQRDEIFFTYSKRVDA
jgi:ribosomal protein S18 acetylase RimI-like enzyme